jgi:hypothetical protein
MTTKLISLTIVFSILGWIVGMNFAHANILCGNVVMGKEGNHLFSRAETGKYREYPIIEIEDHKVTARTPYGKVTVLLVEVPTVTWTNREGEVVPQVCSYIVEPAPAQPTTQYQSPEACHDEEYPINGPYGITGYGHHQVCR